MFYKMLNFILLKHFIMNNYKKGPLEIRFTFMLKGSKILSDGLSPIVFRALFRSQRKDVFTGMSCPPDFWMKAEKMVNLCYPGAKEMNQQLHKIFAHAEETFQKLKFKGDEFTLDDLIDQIKGKSAAPENLSDYIDITLKDVKKRVGIDLAKTTYFRYQRIVKYLNDFLIEKKRVKNLPVSKIDVEFLRDFFHYLRTEKGNSHNTCSSLLGCLKSIIAPAIKKKVIKFNPFDEFTLNRKTVDRDFLEMEEIKQIQDLKCKTVELDFKRDVFVFACFTGLAYADLKAFAKKDIVQDNDGSFFIRHPRAKTGVMSIVPLLPVAEKILKKYSPTDDCRDFVWNVCSNQKLNKGLKQIALATGITKPLFCHLARHTFATTVTLSNGISMESVSKMLGHTSLKHTQIYAKIVASKVKSEMKGLMGMFQ